MDVIFGVWSASRVALKNLTWDDVGILQISKLISKLLQLIQWQLLPKCRTSELMQKVMFS